MIARLGTERFWMRTSAQDLQRRYPLLQVIALIVVFAVGVATLSGFASHTSVDAMLVLSAFLGIAAGGQMLAILVGGIDLSVPNIISGANLITTELCGKNWPFALVATVILATALLVGAINGYVAHHYGVPPIIVTLATGAVVAGGVLAGTHGSVYGSVPNWLNKFVSPVGTVAGVKIPPIVVFWLGFTILMSVVLHFTGMGRNLYATGSNERAARLALVNTERVWTGAFAASALCSAVSGIFLAAWSGTGDPNIGDPYLFLTIAAVIVGGTSLVGANGDYVRTVLGTLILTVLTTILVGHSYSEATQEIFLGLLILLVVGTYGRDRPLRDRV